MSATLEPGSGAAPPAVGDNPTDLARFVADTAQDRQASSKKSEEILLPEDLLPGTREEHVSLREGLRKSGYTTFVILALIVALDNLQSAGLGVLAPNIQASFHVSSGVIVFVAGISGGFLVIGIVPMGWMADRFRRSRIIGFATLFFGVMVFLTGLATNILTFFLARFGVGVTQASAYSVNGTLLADTYPINLRGRIFSAMGMATGDRNRAESRPGGDHRHRGRRVRTAGAGPSTSWASRSSWSPSSPSACVSLPEASTRSSTCSARSLRTPSRFHRPSRPHGPAS